MSAFTFTHNGKTYRIASSESVATKIPGRYMRDVVMGVDNAEIRLGFAMLEHVEADEGAVDALYEMSAEEMMKTLKDWMNHKASEEEVGLGESSGSSD